jgi:hypothetical protein
MTKASKPKSSISSPRQFYAAHPWQLRHKKTRTDVEAYVEASGKWETVLTVYPTSGATAETLANFAVGILNEHQSKIDLLQEAMMALELCLEDDHLTFSSEQVADRAITRIKARISCGAPRKA